jgi:hypothetical protein
MLLKGEALIGTFTFTFAAHGKRGEWHVTVTAPGGMTSECETQEATPYALLNEMLADACDSASHQRIPAPVGAQR